MIQPLLERLDDYRFERAASRITIEAARSRARRGAAYLDAADPGWPHRINPSTLELSDGAHCVLGQLHGEFRTGLLRTRIWDGSSAASLQLFSRAAPEDLGFRARTDAGEKLAALDYAFLNRAWREEIERRRGLPAPAVSTALPPPLREAS
jgi:hypothetical protein